MGTLTQSIDTQLFQLPRGLALEWPGGRAGDPSPSVRLRLRHRSQLARLAQGRIGDLAEDYVRGDLDIEGTPADVMAVAGALVGDPLRRGGGRAWLRWPAWLSGLRSRWHHRIDRDARQVRFHYDVSDSFFALWLDPMRVYSCAYYAEPGMSLAQAQQAKLELVCRKLQLAPGQRFLDIGAGWGGLLTWAAMHHGVKAVGITLSRNQYEHVNRLINDSGLRGQAEVRLLDYRALAAGATGGATGGAAEGTAGGADDGAGDAAGFDRIASVGMFEHVGRSRLVGYFAKLHALLRPGGLLLNHGIAAGGIDNQELGAGMGRFIEKRIFPGGELVHVSHAVEALSRGGLELLDAENLRPHYARTLWAWSDALEAELARARLLTTEATVRAYRLYLAGSAMCFERGWLALYQLLAARPREQPAPGRSWAALSDYPFTRGHMLAPPPPACTGSAPPQPRPIA